MAGEISTVSAHSQVAGLLITQAKVVWLRFLLFIAPCAGLTVLPVYLIDPYDFLAAKKPVVSEEIKAHYAQSVNDPLWKLPKYDRHPAENILLGDSQMEHLRAEDIAPLTGKQYFNLAYGGGTLRESLSTFWHVSARIRLQSVHFGVSFMAYNANPLDRVTAVEKLERHPVDYLYDPGVLRTVFYDVSTIIPGWQVNIGPRVSPEAFWRAQLDYLRSRYRGIVYPEKLKEELRGVASYCGAHGIELVFVITPQHVDAQRRVNELGVAEEYATFKKDLASLAPTLDYDIPSEITRDHRNYSDPFHLTTEASVKVVRDIWLRAFHWGERLPAPAESPTEGMVAH